MTTLCLTILAALASTYGAWVQLKRLRSHGIEGVSTATWASGAGLAGLWAAWGIGAHVPLMVLSEGSFAVLATIVAIRTSTPARAIVGLVVTIAGFASIAITLGTVGFGILGIAGTILCRIPQVIATRRPSIEGISVSAWAFSSASSILWGIVGIITNDAILTIGSLTGLILSTGIITAASWKMRRPMTTAHMEV